MTVDTSEPTSAAAVTDRQVESYRDRGFVRVTQVLTPAEVQRYREALLHFSEHGTALSTEQVFRQFVDVWRADPAIAELTLNKRLAGIAARLAGVPLRLWHDQMLIKPPHNGAPTEFHQDRPYWPHRSEHALSAWIALVDVPVERGCMTFIPGSHRRRDLHAQNLNDSRSLVGMWPELEFTERVTLPLRAGDCTFHNAFTAHTANANDTADPRVAHVVIYTDADTIFTGGSHVVTDPLALRPGDVLPDDRFPRSG